MKKFLIEGAIPKVYEEFNLECAITAVRFFIHTKVSLHWYRKWTFVFNSKRKIYRYQVVQKNRVMFAIFMVFTL